MNGPDDPGGTIPQASNFVIINSTEVSNVNNETESNLVTVNYNFSGMDTEGSILDTDSECKSKRKRTSVKRLCKHCNKKKRKHKSSTIGNESEFECHCNSSIANLNPPSATSIVDSHYP
ncbi:hypothetical protein ACJJTC_001597, partial [Scirpophaga incertulas]